MTQNDNEISRYQVVHIIADNAKDKQISSRNFHKQDDYMPTVNKIVERKNYVKEAHDEFVQTLTEE